MFNKLGNSYWKLFLQVELAILVVAGIFCALFNQLTIHSYGVGLIIAGLIVLALVAYGYMGHQATTRNWLYVYSNSVADKKLKSETDGNLREENTILKAFFSEFFLGLFPLLVGVFLQLL